VRVVREALHALPGAESSVRVHLNPDDIALVRDALAPDALERPIKLVEDVTMTRGGARLETDSSVVDASVEARMGAIAARILGGERREPMGLEEPRGRSARCVRRSSSAARAFASGSSAGST